MKGEKQAVHTDTMVGDVGARRKLLPRGVGGGATLTRAPQTKWAVLSEADHSRSNTTDEQIMSPETWRHSNMMNLDLVFIVYMSEHVCDPQS